ncbi:MAG: hypothetical protein ACHQ4G_00605 [Opitutales bacterium]
MTANIDQTWTETLDWLRAQSRQLVAAARFQALDGLVFYYPVPGGYYPWFYLRDFTYMYESAPEFFPAAEVRAVLEMIFRCARPDGWVPERITSAGEPIYRCHGEADVIDSGPFLVKLVHAYVTATGDHRFAVTHLEALVRALAVLPVETETGLVWIDPARPGTGYGFTDQIAKTGRELFCSLLVLEALDRLAPWLESGPPSKHLTWCRERSARLRRHLDLLWDAGAGLYLAASHDCRQPDIWGSVYACHLGIVAPETRARIVAGFGRERPRHLLRGHVRHLPEPETWQRLIPPWDQTLKAGEFQNGAYWSTPSGWYAEALESVTPGAGADYLIELVAGLREFGVWEWIDRSGRGRNAGNLSSVLLPYASAKRLDARRRLSPPASSPRGR